MLRRLTLFTLWVLCALSTITATAAYTDNFTGGRKDFRDESIYFVITTRFYDGDPTNNVLCWDNQAAQIQSKDPCWRGDFKGLIDKLDYIKALGFTAIWITPVVQNASGYDYHGYHAMDFSSVDLRYESRTAWGAQKDVKFQDLIDAAHAKGLKIVLDIVLQHTGNFGESHFCKLYERDQNIRNQAKIEACMHPTDILGGESYWDIPTNKQYDYRFKFIKNTDGQNHDSNNYWHHLATQWNWDDPSRWWGQIAGDCVDLNTENPAVSEYLVKCYGEFIKMGVDAFRIDTSGHVARLTFNTSFIPQLAALGEQYKSKRLNQCPFYMFGEVCARYSEVTYRDQPNLSPYFYTWKSDQSLMNEFKTYDAKWWASKFVKEGAEPLGNMLTCLKEKAFSNKSDNHLLKNGSYHTPDYSKASGFNVIDFPMHYNFSNPSSALSIAQKGDHLYNDATYNVVYKNGHDYSPQPSDKTRKNPSTADLFFMFTFRGIPCVYYGSEVDFQSGKEIDPGPNGPLSNTGRAYFGHYLEGTVKATDFGEYTASGSVAQTLNSKRSQYIRRLNLIRKAVPALRKGQYQILSTNPIVFKRIYSGSEVVVAMGNYACPSGFYDVWGGTDGYHIYVKGASAQIGKSITNGANPSFTDPGATQWWSKDDVVEGPAVKLSPNGGSFKTSSQKVKATLNEAAASGWYRIGNGNKVSLTKGNTETFTIGNDMDYGESITVTWEATATDGTKGSGSATYKKINPDNLIHAYFINTPGWSNVMCWAWIEGGENFTGGSWPGVNCTKLKQKGDNGEEIWEWTYTGNSSASPAMIIFNNGNGGNGNQTADMVFTNGGFYNFNGATAKPSGFVETAIGNLAKQSSGGYKPIKVYNLSGTHVATVNSVGDAIRSLPRGTYVMNGKKVMIDN